MTYVIRKSFHLPYDLLFRDFWPTCYFISSSTALLPRSQSPNYQRSRKAMGGFNTTSFTPCLFHTRRSQTAAAHAIAKMDRPFGRIDAPSRRLTRQGSAPTTQPSLHTRIHTHTTQRRSRRAPTRTCRATAAALLRLASRSFPRHCRCRH